MTDKSSIDMQTTPQAIIYTEYNEQKHITFADLWDDDVSICPFCQDIDDLNAQIRYNYDKTTDCMFWCNKCRSFGVLLIDTIKSYSEEEMVVKFPEYNVDSMISHKDDLTGTERFVLFDLAKILKISNDALNVYQITDYVDYTKYLNQFMVKDIISVINEYAQISDDDVRQLIVCDLDISSDSKKPKNQIFEKRKIIMDRYNIIKHTYSFIDPNNQYFWKMALIVDSYDAKKPQKKYPAGFDSSCGCIVYLLYLSNQVGSRSEQQPMVLSVRM
jgi:hypothetical protein